VWTPDLAGSGREPVYRRAALEQRLAEIRRAEVGWERFFGRNGIEPLRLTYEAISENYEPSLREALDFLGVDATDVLTTPPSLSAVADQRAVEWYERFRGDLHQSALSSAPRTR
jgi:LPS sulfotransferase NodH